MKFKINLSGFSLIEKQTKAWPGKKLRFTLTWWLENDEGKREMWMEIKGCLARVNINGDLVWTPPQARNGAYQFSVIDVSDNLYKMVAELIANSKYREKLTVHIEKGIPAQLVDATLPMELGESK